MVYSDSHAHLIDYPFESLEKVISLMPKKHIEIALAVGVDITSAERTLKLAEMHEVIQAAIGIHPWFAKKLNTEERIVFEKLAASESTRAMGEIGLDYAPPPGQLPKAMTSADLSNKRPLLPEIPASQEVQKELLMYEVSVAKKYDLPINVHCRGGAHHDMMEILNNGAYSGVKGIAHGFEGDLNMLRDWLDLDFYIALGTKQVIRESLGELEDILRLIPLNRLLTETDARPMSCPEGPLDVIPLVQKISSIKRSNATEIGDTTTSNLVRLLKL